MSRNYTHEHNWYLDDLLGVIVCECGSKDLYMDRDVEFREITCVECSRKFNTDDLEATICSSCLDGYEVLDLEHIGEVI